MPKYKSPTIVLFLLLLSFSYAFTLDSYSSSVRVLENGDLQVYETLVVTLEREYNEGFRSIRYADYEQRTNIVVHSVTVNGNPVPHRVDIRGENAEIVWERTFSGRNTIVLNYTLRDRVQVYDDFAKVCFEFFGADWPVAADRFVGTMRLPESTRGTEMHFEIYSAQRGNAYVDDLSIVAEVENVSPGNYVGGCYLFDKTATTSTHRVDGSALAILQDERAAYGSEEVLAPAEQPFPWCRFPVFLLAVAMAGAMYFQDRGRLRYPESILPPTADAPVVVSVLVRGQYPSKDLAAATLLALINRGVVDILELEHAGSSGGDVKKERTIVRLKTRPTRLSPHETAILDAIFTDGKTEVDLDARAKELDAISARADAQKSPVANAMDRFENALKDIVKEKGLAAASDSTVFKGAIVVLLLFVGFFIFVAIGVDSLAFGVQAWGEARYTEIVFVLLFAIASILLFRYALGIFGRSPVPSPWRETSARWEAFARAVKASRLKEYPPASAVIWGEVLVYATALGLADKVKRHLSELDSFVRSRIDRMEVARRSSYRFYGSAIGVHYLSKYGSRMRGGGSHGGFSSRSSGGWSRGGGGGFGGGRSGGGGFR